MTARKVLVSQKLPDIACDDPKVEQFINQVVRQFIAQNYEQFRRMVVDAEDFARLSASNTFEVGPQILSDPTQGRWILRDEGAAASEKAWGIQSDDGLFQIVVLNDSNGGVSAPVAINRTGTTVDTFTISGVGEIIFGTIVRTAAYTVATLPAGTTGDIAHVTDALAPAFLTIVVGGGAVKTPVFYNGANWVAM